MNVGTVYVKDNGAVAADLRVITSGMVGATVRFVFDSSWDGYSKTLVWKAGDVVKDDTTASGVIPHEVLEVPGDRLVVGVYGVKDGVVTPTLYAKLGPILQGADPSGDPSTDPALPVWMQVQEDIERLEAAKDEAVQAADAADAAAGEADSAANAAQIYVGQAEQQAIAAVNAANAARTSQTGAETAQEAAAAAKGEAVQAVSDAQAQVTAAEAARAAAEDAAERAAASEGVAGKVRPEDTTFFSFGKNLYNAATSTANTVVSSSTGEVTESTGWRTSATIQAKPDTPYVLSGGANGNKISNSRFAAYDKDNNFLAGSRSANPFTTPAETAFLRFSCSNITINVQLEEGTEPTAYEEYGGGCHIKPEYLPPDEGESTSIDDTSTSSETTWSSEKIAVSIDDEVYQDIPYIHWVRGDLTTTYGVERGSEDINKTRLRTPYLDNLRLRIVCDAAAQVNLFYFTKASISGYTGHAGWQSGVLNVADVVPAGTAYIRICARYTNGANITNLDDLLALVSIRSVLGTGGNPYTDFVPDVPESIGVLNAILNAKQLVEIRLTPKATMPQQANDWAADTEKIGFPYSSSRPEEGFVPNFVSLYTFMTAMQNPNSYLYTVDLGEQGNDNGDTYYGAVCSTFCAYALNIVPNYTTHQWQDIPGMEYVPWQSVHALKLGDTICHKTSGHVVMVTDITRNKRGKIGQITVSEAATSKCQKSYYTPEEMEAKYPTDVYAYHRYSKIHEVQHIPSPFVAVEDEEPQNVTYNTAIIPRKGDKANWLATQTVEIDVLEPGSYTGVAIYKGDALLETKPIAALISLSGLEPGSYKACLTDGSNTGAECYWMVVDAESTATSTGNPGEVEVSFSASNATPLFVQWADGSHNGTVHITPLDDGQVSPVVCQHVAGNYKVRVAFQTEYGIVHSVLPEAITV